MKNRLRQQKLALHLHEPEPNVTYHACLRMAQRGLSQSDIQFVLTYGHKLRRSGSLFFFLGKRDIPVELSRLDNKIAKLEGTLLVLSSDGKELITVYKNRKAIQKIKRYRK